MNYLGRPVFEFAIDWAQPINKPFTYDLGALQLGFGAEVFLSAQQYTVQGFDASLWLRSADAIDAFDTFTAALVGRLVGFWFPAPFEGGVIVNVVDTTHFDVVDQKLADTWADNPDQYLYFARAGENAIAAKISNVVDLGTGRERVTIDAAVAFLDLQTIVRRLHYVRLADDVEKARFTAEGMQVRSLRVIELPFEYAAAETGERPIYLYRFWFDAPIDVAWYLTSFASDVASNGQLYSSNATTHGSRRNSTRGDDAIEISAAWNANHPLALFLGPVPITGKLNVQILETTYADLDATTAIFTGRVLDVAEDESGRVTAKCDSWGALLRRKTCRATIQELCNNYLGDFGCKVNLARFETTAQIVSIDSASYPPTIVVTLNTPAAAMEVANYFAQGWLQTGAGTNIELRTVLASSWDAIDEELTLTLNLGLVKAAVGQRINLTPGCDGQRTTCTEKFDNFVNFGGFVAIPARNLSLKAMDIAQSEGGKK